MSGGSNGPDVIVNGGSNSYDRSVAFDAPVAFDTGLYVFPNKTLAELRAELMAALGFAAMTGNPPPGMLTLLNLWLRLAQSNQYLRYACLRTERWWPWQVGAGKRFYDTPIDGLVALNFRKLTDAWIADNGGIPMAQWGATTAFALGAYVLPTVATGLVYEVTTAGTTAASPPAWPEAEGDTVVNGTVTFTARAPLPATWRPLAQGIAPGRFSNAQKSMPDSFELREYLEVWPPPDRPYVVWLKGHMGLRRFTDDDDTCTIDSDVVLLFAIAMGKKHYGQPDADIYAQMCDRMTKEFTAGSHGLQRYLPKPATGGMKCAPDMATRAPPTATWRS